MTDKEFINTFNEYYPFDAENFGVKTDSFLNELYYNRNVGPMQVYYQALNLTKTLVNRYKANKITK